MSPSGGSSRNRRFHRRHPRWVKPKLFIPEYTRWERFKAWVTRHPLDYTPIWRTLP